MRAHFLKSSAHFLGILNPLAIPFLPNGEIDIDSLDFNIKKYESSPLNGYILHGTTGEFLLLTQKEKLDLIKYVRSRISPTRLLISGTSCESTSETIMLTNLAAEYGANMAIILPPHYYLKGVENQIIAKVCLEFYKEIAKNVQIPLIIYNMPKFTSVNLNSSLLVELSNIPNIVGLKECDPNIIKLANLNYTLKNKTLLQSSTVANEAIEFSVFVGSASMVYPAIALKFAHGGICALANLFPSLLSKLAFNASKFTEFNTVSDNLENNFLIKNDRLNEFIMITNELCASSGISGLKSAMTMLGFKGGYARAPLDSYFKPDSHKIIEKHFKKWREFVDMETYYN